MINKGLTIACVIHNNHRFLNFIFYHSMIDSDKTILNKKWLAIEKVLKNCLQKSSVRKSISIYKLNSHSAP